MAFGIPKIGELTAQLDERFKQLIAKLDEILAELRKGDRGGVPLALIIGIVIVIILLGGLGVCGDALFEDEDERNDLGLVRLELVSHEYDEGGYYEDNYEDGGYGGGREDWSNEDRNRNRNRNRGAFSPGPFDDSPIDMRNACISLDCSGREPAKDEQPPDEGEPQ